MKTTTIISILIAVLLIGGAIFLSGNNKNLDNINNVSIVDGKQIIEINAKGGYFPRTTIAQANIPTVIKIETNGTFDCSSALVIPSIGYRTNLSPKGVTEIELSPQKLGTKLQGLCAMGMYNFSIEFN
jgi:plastocyanin domain-containing protein